MKNKLIASISLFITTAATVSQVYASPTVPTFPSCVNPQGALKVSYDSGSHAIIGMDGLKTGSDKVFMVSDYKELIQCFCPENGNGIQTNWYAADKLSSSDIEFLKKEGWLYAADGAAWGLAQLPYVAKNYDYNCKPSTGATPTPTPATSVQGVLSLASTGNTAFLYGLMVVGFTSIVTGLFLRIKK